MPPISRQSPSTSNCVMGACRGRTVLTTAFANLLGFALLIATAWIVAWFKAPPWRKPPARRPEPAARDERATAAPLAATPQPG